jgi:transposase, IS30 family
MYKHLAQEERYYIWLSIANKVSISKIARDLKVARSTVQRELKRNCRLGKAYEPYHAQLIAKSRRSHASSQKQFKRIRPKLRQYITDRLSDGWSPEQISGRLRKKKLKTVSHQTIYAYVRHDKAKGGSLYKLLPHKGKKYNYKALNKYTGPIKDRVDISKRPAVVTRKARIGDFEADTVVGKKSGSYRCLLTMVDRKSKYSFIRKLHAKTAFHVQKAIEDIHSNTIIPFKSITPDNGGEFAHHKQIQENIDCPFYFARPYRSTDRGLNEHTNGLIRRYLPKRTDFAKVSNDIIQQIQDHLNNRPRKVLGFLTPKEVMLKHLKRIYPKIHMQQLIL